MKIIQNLPYELTQDEVIKELKLRNISDKVMEIISEVLNIVRNSALPKAVYKECYIGKIDGDRVLIDGVELRSHILSINVKNVGRVFPYVVTVGSEVDKIKMGNSDILASYILDLAKEMVLRKARETFESILFEKFKIEKGSYMSPGSLIDWPISQQKVLFKLIGNIQNSIGVELLESYLMKPVKTVSGIYFPTEFDFKSCMLCPRENCPSRKATFDLQMYEKYMGKVLD